MIALSTKRRSELRAEAHKLSPIVIVGDKGLTDEVIAEIDRSLKAHELIKVRAAGGDRDVREAWLGTICERLAAHPVQRIGKVFVIYRERPEEAGEPRAPKAEERRGRPRGEVVTTRGKQAQRARDAEKQRLRDIADMVRKGKIPQKGKFGVAPSSPRGAAPDDERTAGGRGDEATRTARPRSRTPSPLPESAPRRRRPTTSR